MGVSVREMKMDVEFSQKRMEPVDAGQQAPSHVTTVVSASGQNYLTGEQILGGAGHQSASCTWLALMPLVCGKVAAFVWAKPVIRPAMIASAMRTVSRLLRTFVTTIEFPSPLLTCLICFRRYFSGRAISCPSTMYVRLIDEIISVLSVYFQSVLFFDRISISKQ